MSKTLQSVCLNQCLGFSHPPPPPQASNRLHREKPVRGLQVRPALQGWSRGTLPAIPSSSRRTIAPEHRRADPDGLEIWPRLPSAHHPPRKRPPPSRLSPGNAPRCRKARATHRLPDSRKPSFPACAACSTTPRSTCSSNGGSEAWEQSVLCGSLFRSKACPTNPSSMCSRCCSLRWATTPAPCWKLCFTVYYGNGACAFW